VAPFGDVSLLNNLIAFVTELLTSSKPVLKLTVYKQVTRAECTFVNQTDIANVMLHTAFKNIQKKYNHNTI